MLVSREEEFDRKNVSEWLKTGFHTAEAKQFDSSGKNSNRAELKISQFIKSTIKLSCFLPVNELLFSPEAFANQFTDA
jgi:hypothetical protein